MKTKLTLIHRGAVLLLLSTLNHQLPTHAQGTAFTYQGWLNDGANPASGVYDLRFEIYDAAGGGAAQGRPLTNSAVSVSNGLFTVTLDFGGGVFPGANRWLEIGVRISSGDPGFTTLVPRQPITATPYAIRAGTVTGPINGALITAGTITGTQLAAGAVTSAQIASNTITGAQLAPGAAAANLGGAGFGQLPSGAIVMSATPVNTAFTQAGLQRVAGELVSAEKWQDIPPGPPASGTLNSARYEHGMAWSGTYLFAVGGDPLSFGVRYNAGANTWIITNPTNAPVLDRCKVFWIGTDFLVWDAYHRVGGKYNPASNTWQPVSDVGAPSARENETMIWTGTNLIVWGGTEAGAFTKLNTGGRYNPATDSWTATSTTGAPTAREKHAAVWTGSRMFVSGGYDGDALGDGGLYNPSANTWTAVSSGHRRYSHTAVWSGSVVLVWGGLNKPLCPPLLGQPYADYARTGQRYNPITDTWTVLAANTTVEERIAHTAVWTGNEMIIWGGLSGEKFHNCAGSEASPKTEEGTGARYNPTSDTWAALPDSDGPARAGHGAVWTGTQMLVWGGYSIVPVFIPPFTTIYSKVEMDAGLRYTPANNSWVTMSASPATGEPSQRHNTTAIWTGSEVLVWGGESSGIRLRTGGSYRPGIGWTNLPTAGAPSARMDHTAVWTGTEMIIWGGQANAPVNTGARFNVASNAWVEVSTVNAPRARRRHGAVWTGTEMIVWGGYDSTNVFNPTFLKDGGRYNPATDTWTMLTNAPFTLGGRASPTAVWTGDEMIVWGGYTHSGGLTPTFTYFGTGARYNPTTDTWNILPLGNTPIGRTAHTAVWTGNGMLVWGGYTTAGETNTGAAYDPALNTWTPLSTNGAPTKRMEHTAAWTGREMLVWGGLTGSTELNTGGSYDPASGLWTSLTASNAPAARTLHSTAWAGGEMLILNGQRDTTEYGAVTNDNKNYSPARTYYLFQKP